MFSNKSVETIVVGAGPSGMMAALALAHQGVSVAIVDAADRCCTRSNALALHPATLKLLDRFGLVERALEKGYRIDKVLVYDDVQPRETVHLNELPVAFPYALCLPQSDLEDLLEDELNRLGARILWNHRVSGVAQAENGLIVDVDRYCERGTGYAVSHTEHVIDKTFHYHARLLVAADGYDSLLRRLTKVSQSRLGQDHYYAFFEFETDMDPQHAIRVSLQDKLATAQYPMSGGLARLAVQFSGMTLPPEYRKKDRAFLQDRYDNPELLDDPHLAELIETRVPWGAGYINRVRYRAVAPFEKRYLKSPLRDRVFFLGDAARSFGPLSMTSLNLGLQEAEQLAIGYKQSRGTGRSLHHLGAIGETMVAHWTALAGIGKHSMPIDLADPWVSANRARILRALPATGEALERLAAQLFLHISQTELADAL